MPDFTALRQTVIDAVHDLACHAENVTVVVAVPSIEQLTILTANGRLYRSGTCIKADEYPPLVAVKRSFGNDLLVMARLEGTIVILCRKQRIQTGDLGPLDVPKLVKRIDDLCK